MAATFGLEVLTDSDQLPVSNPPLPTLLPFLVKTLVAASLDTPSPPECR